MINRADELEFGETAGRQEARSAAELVCAGGDLKAMLAQLSRHFAEADQRNSVALNEMRGRLETLGRTAETLRDHVPAQYAPAFARIEDGVQQLAERVAVIGREREFANAAATLTPARTQSDADNVRTAAAPAFEAPHAAAAVADTRPAPHDAHSLPGNAADPWDRDSADALARIYDDGETGLAAVPHEQPVPVAPPVMAFAAPAQAEPTDRAAMPASPAHPADRAWLEECFAAIATRIEQSLAEMRPDNALLAFDDRLEQFEHRFSNALDEVATRADVEGLRIIEAHINELTTQFERAQTQFSRLDQIEMQLGDLLHQVSDDRLASLLGQSPPAAHRGPTAEEIEVVAMAVADRMASHVPPQDGQHAGDQVQGSIADLKRVVESFVAGQRDNEEHTSTMLDTMQQAMIRMLDRMDAIENAPPSYAAPPASFGAPGPSQVAAPQVAMPRSEPAPRTEPMFDDEAAASEPPAGNPAGRPTPQNKEDFRAAAIADARRAARKVAAQASDAQSPQPEGMRVRRGAPAVEVSSAKPELVEKSRSRTPLMVAGIALVAAIGFLAASVGLNRGTAITGAERQTAQQKAPLAIDNGSAAAGAGDLADGAPKNATPTPSIGDNGAAATRPAPTAVPAVPRPQRPGASLVEPRGPVRSKAETSVESLGEQRVMPSEELAPQYEATLRTQPVSPLGITVTPANAVPGNSDLARMRQQRNMASLASQLAAVQANAPAVPASLLPEGAARAAAEADGAAATDTIAPAEMPPAQIGPNSLRLAAQKGDPSAEFEVAARFAEGRGIGQDFKQAMVWYQRAAQRGFAPAQYRLGTLYERGIGTKADLARAKVWYGRAAEQGHVKAMHNLAVLNAGREQSSDYATAVHWFTAAAERGLADSQYNLGVLYESGLGLPRDLKQAYHWLSLAARSGDKEAARRREQVRMKLEETDVADAEQVIEGWRATPIDAVVNEARAAGEVWKQRQSASR